MKVAHEGILNAIEIQTYRNNSALSDYAKWRCEVKKDSKGWEYCEQMRLLNDETNDLIGDIDNLKILLLSKSLKISIDSAKNIPIDSACLNCDLFYKLNEVNQYKLIVSDFIEIKNKINLHLDSLLVLVNPKDKEDFKKNELFDYYLNTKEWLNKYFKNGTLYCNIISLDKIKLNILISEFNTISNTQMYSWGALPEFEPVQTLVIPQK